MAFDMPGVALRCTPGYGIAHLRRAAWKITKRDTTRLMRSASFTLADDPDSSIHVTDLSLKVDTGSSATDGATAINTVEGTIYGGSGVTRRKGE